MSEPKLSDPTKDPLWWRMIDIRLSLYGDIDALERWARAVQAKGATYQEWFAAVEPMLDYAWYLASEKDE